MKRESALIPWESLSFDEGALSPETYNHHRSSGHYSPFTGLKSYSGDSFIHSTSNWVYCAQGSYWDLGVERSRAPCLQKLHSSGEMCANLVTRAAERVNSRHSFRKKGFVVPSETRAGSDGKCTSAFLTKLSLFANFQIYKFHKCLGKRFSEAHMVLRGRF